MSRSLHAEDNAVKIAARLSVFATVAVTGLTLAATGPAVASPTPAAGHPTAVTSGTKLWEARYAASGRGAFSFASAVSPDGSEVFVTGDVNTPEPGTIPTLAAVAYSS
jgi:hypothetical protein